MKVSQTLRAVFDRHIGRVWYLASPYKHKDPNIRCGRARLATAATAALVEAGIWVFSPIAHSCTLVPHMSKDHGTAFKYWAEYDLAILERCGNIAVLHIDGWQQSVGVSAEERYAWGRVFNRIDIRIHGDTLQIAHGNYTGRLMA